MELRQNDSGVDGPIFDCIIIGAGPGGLQAAIYLGRYRRRVLLLDRGGGRTAHARSIENFLTWKEISGKKMIELGMEQARSFGVRVEKAEVTSVLRKERFEVITRDAVYRSRFVIVSTGVVDLLPDLGNMPRFFGTSFFTCVDCDGYKTVGKKLAVLGDSIESVRLAFAMQELYTREVSLVLSGYLPPPDYLAELRERGIVLFRGEPARIIGEERMEAVELKDGSRVPCEAALSNFGFRLNDRFLKEFELKRSANGSITVSSTYESSVSGLYVVGPLNTGNDQAVIAAGEGAVAAIAINKSMFEF